MKKLKILTMCAVVAGVISCYGQTENGIQDKTNTKTDIKKDDPLGTGLDINPASTTTDWSRQYETDMDISPMYGELKMSNQQINDYETSNKSYSEKWSKNSANRPADNQAILIHKDSSLQSVLSPEQYKQYQGMVKKSKNDKK